MGDMRTPVRISIALLFANFVANVIFVKVLGMDIEGLALATGLCAWGNLFLLWPGLCTRLGLPPQQSDFLRRVVRAGLCSVASAGTSWIVYRVLAGDARSTSALALSILTGVGVYALLAHLLRIPEWQHLCSRISRASQDEA
jgi:peptidoglycan biosynthesis protein MviN/MurJ (putative lipid II flippase)